MNRRVFTLSGLASLMGAAVNLTAIPGIAQQSGTGGGSATGGVHTGVYDAEHRPITAGGFVKNGPIVFQDVARQAGLTEFQHRMGTPEKKFIIETVGSGVGLIDYDNDGWLDIYMVNGSTKDAMDGKAPAPRAALFHNNRDGTFTDVAEKAHVLNERWGFGVAVADFDNDGWPDMYVTNFGKNRLYKNNRDGTFTDIGETAGVALGNWSTGATWGDYNGDGLLDLFVPGYLHWNLENPPVPGQGGLSQMFCNYRGAATMCGPRGLPGQPDHLFRNNGDSTFTDVSTEAGVGDSSNYYGLQSVFANFNNKGRVDLVVSDDSTPNYFYANMGNGKFEDDSYASGFALNSAGRETATMGVAVADYDNDGQLDIATTDFSDDYFVLYQNDGQANFTDVSYQSGIATDTIPFLGFGIGWIDFDNDGWKDLLYVNGHVYPQVDQHDWGMSYAQRPLLFKNNAGKNFDLMPAVEGTGLAVTIVGRGAAFGDLFNDGKMAVVINVMDGHPVLLKNVCETKNHWVAFKLIGGPKGPRDAVGAAVYVTANGMRQRVDVIAGESYFSTNDIRPHFGLGSAEKIDLVEIHWPSGTIEKMDVPDVDKMYTVEEGKRIVL